MSRPIVTRFAPSPTGYLHIGGARTALFNWYFAKKMGGTFRLRIEDTDRARSTDEATAAILKGMSWLGLSADDDIVYQENNQAFRSPYRDSTETKDMPFAVRFRVPDGETKITDHVQGDVTWQNESFDDLVLLRADGTPTYMLAVVVDDHDMGITHVIRGDDHFGATAIARFS